LGAVVGVVVFLLILAPLDLLVEQVRPWRFESVEARQNESMVLAAVGFLAAALIPYFAIRALQERKTKA
jgi:ABC-type Fe3+-siderophore transport system permease subunit